MTLSGGAIKIQKSKSQKIQSLMSNVQFPELHPAKRRIPRIASRQTSNLPNFIPQNVQFPEFHPAIPRIAFRQTSNSPNYVPANVEFPRHATKIGQHPFPKTGCVHMRSRISSRQMSNSLAASAVGSGKARQSQAEPGRARQNEAEAARPS